MKIMLDPGHYGSCYNSSPAAAGYYESAMTWSLAEKLKRELEDYGFSVELTRGYEENPELVERGKMAKGCRLFLSLHSNASASESADAPWMIHLAPDGRTDVDEESERVAAVLGPVISEVMGVSPPVFYTRQTDFDRDGDGDGGDEWYGVLFGAKSVGVPGVIVEHSFHTNKNAALWLMSEENLNKLASAEAAALARYYGMEKTVSSSEKERLETAISALEEKVKSLNEQVGTKWAYLDENLPGWAAPTVKKLVERGSLKGGEHNSYELSRMLLRVLVILDREGLFDNR